MVTFSGVSAKKTHKYNKPLNQSAASGTLGEPRSNPKSRLYQEDSKNKRIAVSGNDRDTFPYCPVEL